MQSVLDENELINRTINLKSWSGFSKVHQISTVKLSPDIDFLRIDEVKERTEGYEFKLIKYNKAWKKANLMPMYTGLGEAFHYFQFGVDRSNLVLGLSNSIPSDALNVALKKVEELAQTFISLLTFSISAPKLGVGSRCLGIYIWNERNNVLGQALYASQDFPMTENNKHLKECLLRGEFKYAKKF